MPLKSSSVLYLSTTLAKLKLVFNRLRPFLHMLNTFLYEPPRLGVCQLNGPDDETSLQLLNPLAVNLSLCPCELTTQI